VTVTPVATATLVASPTPESTPIQLASGFVPPDKNTAKCEDAVARDLAKLAACIRKCHIKQADLALKQKPFDEESCETGADKSCRAKYDAASASLETKAICPSCLDAAARGDLADQVTNAIDGSEQGDVYCAGTTVFGGDDSGFVPPDNDTSKCEDAVTKAVATFAGCVSKCEMKQAAVEFKGKPFDKAACESGAKSCRTKYDAASGKLDQKGTCPSCLDAAARGSVADMTRDFLEQHQAQIYCAGTVPLE